MKPKIIEYQATIEAYLQDIDMNQSIQNNNSSSNIHTNINGNDNHLTINYYSNKTPEEELFIELIKLAQTIRGNTEILKSIDAMKSSIRTEGFTQKYKYFMSIISDHVSVFTPMFTKLTEYL